MKFTRVIITFPIRILQTVCADLFFPYGYSNNSSIDGSTCLLLIVDVFSSYVTDYPLKTKSEAGKLFNDFKNKTETPHNVKISD